MYALQHGKHGRRPAGHISPSARVMDRVKRALAFLLLLSAMMGLLGVQTAAAATPLSAMTMAMPAHTDTSAMPADCMAMMSQHAPQPDKQPCTGITLDCIAAMGCAMPFIAPPVALDVRTGIAKPNYAMPIAPALVGNDIAPEPEPPTILS